MNHTQQEKPMDARTYQTRIGALAQQLQAPLTEPALRQVLHELLVLYQTRLDAYQALVSDYERCTVTLRTVTETCTRLAAERQALAQAMLRTPDTALRLCHICHTAMD